MSYTVRTHYLVLFIFVAGILGIYFWDAVTTPGYKGERLERFLCQTGLAAVTLFLSVFYCLHTKRSPNPLPVEYILGHPTRMLAAAVAAYVLVAILIAYFVLQSFPNSGDEYDYVFQGMTFSAGKLWNDPPLATDFFKVPWMIIKDNKWTTQYDPGWPSVLALAITAGLPTWLVGPFVGLTLLVVFILLVRRVEDDITALLCAVVCAATPFFLFNTASYFNHGLAGLFGLLFVYFAARHFETNSPKAAVLAGAFLGALALTRNYSAILFVLPVLVMICRSGITSIPARALWFGLGGLPFVVALLIYNGLVTGNPLLPVKSWGYRDPELYPFASLWVEGGFHKSIVHTASYVFESSEYVWPLFSVLYFGALIYRVRTNTVRFCDWYPLLFVAGFLAFAADAGNRYGPRYYFEAFPFAILTICSATVHLIRSRRHQLAGRIAIHLFASQVLVGATAVPFIAWLQNTIIAERTDVFRLVEKQGLDNAIVFIRDPTGVLSPMIQEDLLRNGIDFSGSVLYAVDLGPRNNELIESFPDKAIWIYHRQENAHKGTLERAHSHLR